MNKKQTAYCICCGEDVPVEICSIGIKGEDLLRCTHCGAYLGTTKKPQTLDAPAPPPPAPMPQEPMPGPDFATDVSAAGASMIPEIPGDLASAIKDAGKAVGREIIQDASIKNPERADGSKPPLDYVLIAEDLDLLRLMLKDMLVSKGLTSEVTSCKNGFELVSEYIRQSRGKNLPGLVILDVRMPLLNGIAAAVALRSYERGTGITPVPVLFFTSKRCDNTFRKAINYCRPAMYVNKGASESAKHLEDRVGKVIDQLLKQEW